MTREEALKEILRRAHREHGTCVLTLRRIEREVTDLRRYVGNHIGAPDDRIHIGYLAGVANTLELLEEALFEVFNVWPADRRSLGDDLPLPEEIPRPVAVLRRSSR